jgi:dipeptidyl-peptidase-4
LFSSGFKYYINYFSNTSTPTQVSLYNASGKLVRVLEDNKDLQATLKKYTYAPKEFIKIETKDGTELNAWMLKPANFDANKKYPVLMTQYSGPNSQEVLNSWSFGWEYLLAQEDFIVVCVDPRGTGARGEAFRKVTYLQLGKYESDDMVEAANYLASLAYVDKTKVGIWGWSFGGFMTLLSLEKGNGVFRTGISVAPVTNWRYYDNIYTERFMRTPQENASGYDNNSPINLVNNLQGKLFLIHGMADDNVHFQNSVEFIAAAIEANKDIRVMVYPNRNHGISGGNTRWYLYSQMHNFLLKELKE